MGLMSNPWGAPRREAHMKASEAIPISDGAARFAKTDLTRYGAGSVAFWSLVARHITDPKVVLDTL